MDRHLIPSSFTVTTDVNERTEPNSRRNADAGNLSISVGAPAGTTMFRIPEEWAKAPEFVPRCRRGWLDAPEFVPRSTSNLALLSPSIQTDAVQVPPTVPVRVVSPVAVVVPSTSGMAISEGTISSTLTAGKNRSKKDKVGSASPAEHNDVNQDVTALQPASAIELRSPNWVNAPEFIPRNSFAPSLPIVPSRENSSNAERSIIAPARLLADRRNRSSNSGSTSRSAVLTPNEVGSSTARTRLDGLPRLENAPIEHDVEQLWNARAQCIQTGALLPTPIPFAPRNSGERLTVAEADLEICPYGLIGECRYGDGCCFVHGNTCEYCGLNALHPRCTEQAASHKKSCLEQMERDMEYSFAVAATAEKTCYICYDVIMDKEAPGDQRFGILPGCFHCFCLGCIRSWRQRAREFESRVGRSCPVCRIPSDYIVPSRFWVDSQVEKDRLITSYKSGMRSKKCRYFAGGSGFCPFGEKCFYLHAIDERGRRTSSTSSGDNALVDALVGDELGVLARSRLLNPGRQTSIQITVENILDLEFEDEFLLDDDEEW